MYLKSNTSLRKVSFEKLTGKAFTQTFSNIYPLYCKKPDSFPASAYSNRKLLVASFCMVLSIYKETEAMLLNSGSCHLFSRNVTTANAHWEKYCKVQSPGLIAMKWLSNFQIAIQAIQVLWLCPGRHQSNQAHGELQHHCHLSLKQNTLMDAVLSRSLASIYQ